MNKRHVVALSEAERAELAGVTRRGVASARVIARAHVLRLADEGVRDLAIAAALHVGVRLVERTRRKYAEGGLQHALYERRRPGARRKLDGKEEAFLVATACSAPPAGRATWTMQLLADHLVTVGVVDAISDETVRRTLKKTRSGRG